MFGEVRRTAILIVTPVIYQICWIVSPITFQTPIVCLSHTFLTAVYSCFQKYDNWWFQNSLHRKICYEKLIWHFTRWKILKLYILLMSKHYMTIYTSSSSSSSCRAAGTDITDSHSLATPPYRSSSLVGLQGYIPYPHIAAECMFELVVHRSTSLMSSSLLLQQCPACLVRLTWIVFVMGGGWPYSWCLVGSCHQDLFNIARCVLV